jgi:hypothetical protein
MIVTPNDMPDLSAQQVFCQWPFAFAVMLPYKMLPNIAVVFFFGNLSSLEGVVGGTIAEEVWRRYLVQNQYSRLPAL